MGLTSGIYASDIAACRFPRDLDDTITYSSQCYLHTGCTKHAVHVNELSQQGAGHHLGVVCLVATNNSSCTNRLVRLALIQSWTSFILRQSMDIFMCILPLHRPVDAPQVQVLSHDNLLFTSH